jgi:serine/threonine-protein kinase
VVHRDIKPDNILLQDGTALIADFGIALAISKSGRDRLTNPGMALGTPQYMSPEQAAGELEIDSRTDIYSLGCVLHEMLAGAVPYTGRNTQAVIAQLMSASPPPLGTRNPAVPKHVEQAVLTALAREPSDRFQTARAFADALGVHLTPVSGARPALPRMSEAEKQVRIWRAVAIGAICLALAAVLFALF